MNVNVLISCLLIGLISVGCTGFLEDKPDIKMVIPHTLEDAELLLNNYNTMNMGYPTWGEWGIDDYYVTDQTFNGALTIDQRNAYTWADAPYEAFTQWQLPYKAVFNANQALTIIQSADVTAALDRRDNLKGVALFFRAFAFQQLLELHASAYQKETADKELGIPLRLGSEIDKSSVRVSLQQSYEQIIRDYQAALPMLPLHESIKGRPFRASAYAGLARAYLNMADYHLAYAYADSSIRIHGALMDFNLLDASKDFPIPQFNMEVLFPAVTGVAGPMSRTNGRIAPELYESYEDTDLRKSIFFLKANIPTGSYSFKGAYNQSISSLFVGLTTSEMYLVKAECAIRLGLIDEALDAINTLLKNRIDQTFFAPVSERSPEALLRIILSERRKELVFRGRRWADLKRLNLDTSFQKVIERTVDGKVYVLEPNSRKYAFRLPEPVVTIGKIPQNIR